MSLLHGSTLASFCENRYCEKLKRGRGGGGGGGGDYEVQMRADINKLNKFVEVKRVQVFCFVLFFCFCFFVFLVHCLVVTWLVPRETAAVSPHVLCTPYNHSPVYSVTSFEAI